MLSQTWDEDRPPRSSHIAIDQLFPVGIFKGNNPGTKILKLLKMPKQGLVEVDLSHDIAI